MSGPVAISALIDMYLLYSTNHEDLYIRCRLLYFCVFYGFCSACCFLLIVAACFDVHVAYILFVH